MKKICLYITLSLYTIAGIAQSDKDIITVDKKATAGTKALYFNLLKIQNEGGIIFGQQDATLYGCSWSGETDRSDVKDITGTHPAMIGLDFESITRQDDKELRTRQTQQLVDEVKKTYRRGGIITFSWHMRNPANDGSFYWEKNPVKAISDILPDGSLHETYKRYLKTVAEISSQFVNDNGELIPIIFRPFHEFDGEWFWWGKGYCTKEEYISLWQFTINYLKDDSGVHNFLYAFSPDCRFTTTDEYLDYYPGDGYVDILGMDDYWDFRPDGANDPSLAEHKLRIVSNIASSKNKVAAFTETGLKGVKDPKWYTTKLLPILQKVKLSYVMVWRNANDMEHHFYTPTKGHPAEKDFLLFSKEPNILFESDLSDMYKISSSDITGNPIFRGWYADPEAVIYDDKYWVYPTYSGATYTDQVYLDAFSSPDLVNWTKHSQVLDTISVKWIWRAMWAPAAFEKDGRYYLLFGGNDIQNDNEYGGIGIAVADKPEGPFKDYLSKPLIDKFHNGAQPIDQFVFKDSDGSYYLYYGGWRHCNVAKFNDDFTDFVPLSDGSIFKEVTPDGYVEGPFMFIRNGKYYFMWSEGDWVGPDYCVAYAISDNPFGPFERIGKILQQNPKIATGAGHHSVVHEPKSNKWYIFYHRHPLDREEGYCRETCIEEMQFDNKGFIKPVTITNVGVHKNELK